jgi:hypothetical protein
MREMVAVSARKIVIPPADSDIAPSVGLGDAEELEPVASDPVPFKASATCWNAEKLRAELSTELTALIKGSIKHFAKGNSLCTHKTIPAPQWDCGVFCLHCR